MTYIALGIFSFLIIHLIDFVSLKRIPLARPLTWGAGSALPGYGVVMVQTEKRCLPL